MHAGAFDFPARGRRNAAFSAVRAYYAIEHDLCKTGHVHKRIRNARRRGSQRSMMQIEIFTTRNREGIPA
jgi:hypothetical protein